MNMNLRKPATYIAIVVIALCVWGSYHALRMGVADVIAYKAKYQVKIWEKAGRLPAQDEVDYALEKAASALAWEPGNPEHMDLKAHVLIYQSLLYWGETEFAASSAEALALYQQSTQRRPKWPYTWARLALVKAYRGEFDDVYAEAVAKSVTYGPWEPGVHKTLTEAGLPGWLQLDKVTRTHLVGNIYRGLRFEQRALSAMVKRHNKLELVCAYLPNDKYTKKFCGW